MKIELLLSVVSVLVLSGCAGRSLEEKKLQQFIDNHVGVIEPKQKANNLANWNASVTGESKYYDEKSALDLEIKKIYSNREEFERLKAWKESGKIDDPILSRELTVLYNSYLPNQIDTALTREIVEKSTRIEQTFNTSRPKMGGKKVNDNVLSDILRTEIDSNKRRLAWEASKRVGQTVAPMVLELVRLRNQAAKQLGFDNYYVMSLIAAEQDANEILSIFDRLKELTDAPYKRMKETIDSELSKKYGIRPDQMMPWHYQDRFFQEVPAVGGVDLDRFFKGKKADSLAAVFFQGIGLPVEDILKNSDLYGRPGKYQHAFCTDIDRKGDVRVILSLTDSHYWASTMLHELGHGLYSINIRRDLPFLLRDQAHLFLTEAIAQLMERQTNNADWLQAMFGLSDAEKEAIRVNLQENLRMKVVIFSRWSQVMLRFERSLYENPDQDLNKLWWDLVEEYQFVKRPGNRNQPDWAAKIHLALYPVYYHNYMLGELAASQILNTMVRKALKRPDFTEVSFAGKPEIGSFLTKNIFQPGMSLYWNDLMKKATGEPLTPKYFAEEFVEK